MTTSDDIVAAFGPRFSVIDRYFGYCGHEVVRMQYCDTNVGVVIVMMPSGYYGDKTIVALWDRIYRGRYGLAEKCWYDNPYEPVHDCVRTLDDIPSITRRILADTSI